MKAGESHGKKRYCLHGMAVAHNIRLHLLLRYTPELNPIKIYGMRCGKKASVMRYSKA